LVPKASPQIVRKMDNRGTTWLATSNDKSPAQSYLPVDDRKYLSVGLLLGPLPEAGAVLVMAEGASRRPETSNTVVSWLSRPVGSRECELYLPTVVRGVAAGPVQSQLRAT
jgi:hypothetical protein